MDRFQASTSCGLACIPHTRGDGPIKSFQGHLEGWYSPHAWGWTAVGVLVGRVNQVFPTRVGMDRRLAYWQGGIGGIPHTRGDGPDTQFHLDCGGRYSPHAWGWTVISQPSRSKGWVFPTRVGMDRHSCGEPVWLPRIPHTRGDGPRPFADYPVPIRYSPHAWGWTAGVSLV